MPKKRKSAPKKKKTMKKKKSKRKAAKKSSKKKGKTKAKKKAKARRAKPQPKKKAKAKSQKTKAKPAVKKVVAVEAPPPSLPMEPVALLHEGDAAPEFSASTDQGNVVSLADLRGKKVVLYFYPKDDTPGCTREACAFRDGIAQIQAKGAVVLGVSTDSVDSHQKFREKYNLNFPLLSDENKNIVEAYGVWKEKNMYGRAFMGIERTTFLINEEGRIQKIFPKVNVEVHYDEVLQALG